ncbi:MAG TPA: type II secretion system protein [Tepidisphaeraceae bacterium]|jgi:prepilin-type N-terminal cleavage/methylation domain-containing protein
MRHRFSEFAGFSLIEVVIVVVILGTIGAIALPRLSHAGQSADEKALAGDMAVWRNALDLYQGDHGGAFPKDSTTVAAQLTGYTDANGEVSATKDAVHPFGPYLRTISPLPAFEGIAGAEIPRASTTIGATLLGGAPTRVLPNGYGWLYDGAGHVYPNTGPLTDLAGKLYNSY